MRQDLVGSQVGDREAGHMTRETRATGGDLFPVLTSANLSYSVIIGSGCLLECKV